MSQRDEVAEALNLDPRDSKRDDMVYIGAYDMPTNRTWCGHYRCCREANHEGDCEEDITYLTYQELDAIRKSGVTYDCP